MVLGACRARLDRSSCATYIERIRLHQFALDYQAS
jgi:hypothetical protein